MTPWMIRLPIEMQVMLPYEVLHPPAPPSAPPPPALPPPVPNRADPDLHPEPAAWRLGNIPLPRVPPDRDEPISGRSLLKPPI